MAARTLTVAVLCTLLLAACQLGSDDGAPATGSEPATTDAESARGERYPPGPSTASGPLDPEAAATVDALLDGLERTEVEPETIEAVAELEDPRLLWLISDLLRFATPGSQLGDSALAAFAELSGVTLDEDQLRGSVWRTITDHLLAWDLPAWPGYEDAKARLLTGIEPAWEPYFDGSAAVDWRTVTWGGVRIDNRSIGSTAPCPNGCIPALEDPGLVDAADGDWYDDDGLVFGVRHGDEAVALPRHQMEVHELVTLTLDGRQVSVSHCTLCGAPVAFLTDEVTEDVDRVRPRTSGLLQQSNKIMVDLHTDSMIHAFTGEALSGPLREAGVQLERLSVAVSTWQAWRADHPDTLILAEDGGIGRTYPDDPLGGRDDDGPIFPIGEADPSLPEHETVVGATAPDGTPVAFPVDDARAALRDDREVALAGVTAELAGDGIALRADGDELPSHQAFWFAWSQFHPDTLLWGRD